MNPPVTTPPVILTIAGSDSGAGAGLQADLKTIAALGGYGVSVVSALTAQNTAEVRARHTPPIEFFDAQLDAVLEDFDVQAVKTGLLASAEIVARVGARAARGDLPNLVVDPVLVSSRGDALFDAEVEAAYRECVLAHAHVLTPNVAEAARLLGRAVVSDDDVRNAAAELASFGPSTVIVTGGRHCDPKSAVDVVYSAGMHGELRAPRVATANTHGTGCSLSAAIATGLGQGRPGLEAVAAAKAFVHAGLVGSCDWKLGRGPGPIDHFVDLRSS
ncbi:MAG: bifunctional hydroxymethylpyrimidine kinase/phosphomethylpyrimidine kinase [Acidimicrobiia bacterium]